MQTLVIGGNGQLGRHLREELQGAEFWDRSVIDLSDIHLLESKLAVVKPGAIINAAAYTAVDKAESEGTLAWKINADVPAVLAMAAQRLGIPLLHVSTDYVFDGEKAGGYTEADAVNPLGAYGRSKLGGELAVRSLCTRHWILRTSWVFSEYGHNFAKTMIRLARERDQLRVVHDQRGRPTYAGDLARCIARILASLQGEAPLPWGVHHVGGGRVVSWKEFADAILRGASSAGLLPRIPTVTGIPTTEYPTPAARPRNSLLLTREATADLVGKPFDWEVGLVRMYSALS